MRSIGAVFVAPALNSAHILPLTPLPVACGFVAHQAVISRVDAVLSVIDAFVPNEAAAVNRPVESITLRVAAQTLFLQIRGALVNVAFIVYETVTLIKLPLRLVNNWSTF